MELGGASKMAVSPTAVPAVERRATLGEDAVPAPGPARREEPAVAATFSHGQAVEARGKAVEIENTCSLQVSQ